MTEKNKKRFIIRKYVMANSIKEAMKKEKKEEPYDIFWDQDYEDVGDMKEENTLGFKDK